MNKTYLICDESGAKGYSDKEETIEGEFGIFAGYFVNEDQIELITSESEKIYGKYKNEEGKLHITDLNTQKQQELRDEIFEFIREKNISCVYEAISVKGYKSDFEKKSNKKNELIAEMPHLSFSKNSNKERLHSELFQGLFGKSLAYFIDNYGEDEINIKIVTDNIEESLKKEFEKKAIELIKPFPYKKTVSAFDKLNKQKVSGEINFNSHQLENDSISKSIFEIIVENNGLTLIADVLANSLNYYIKEVLKENPNTKLNSINAIEKHPLKQFFYGISDENNNNFVSDILFGRMNSD